MRQSDWFLEFGIMNPRQALCIYCAERFDPMVGEGDHIIPRGFGEFVDDNRFRRMCKSCNSIIGRCEQQLLNCGPEGYLRRYLPLTTKRRGRQGLGKAQAAGGAPPPKATVTTGEFTQLVAPDDSEIFSASHVDQLVVRDKDGKECQVRLYPSIRSEQVRRAIDIAGLSEMASVYFNCSDDLHVDAKRIIKALWPKSTSEDLPTIDPCVHKTRGRISFEAKEDYFRAIAKIAFHHYLQYGRRQLRGCESTFEELRRFIMSGGDVEKFFRPPRQSPRLPMDDERLPDRWCHFIMADETTNPIVVRVVLCAGPEVLLHGHSVALGSSESELAVPSWIWGHQFVFDEDAPGKRSGFMGSLGVSRIQSPGLGFRPVARQDRLGRSV